MIAIIGKPGVGKTHFLKKMQLLGYSIFISDEYIHQLYKKDHIGYQLIKKKFGKRFLNENEVNRDKLLKFAMQNNNFLKVKQLIYPLIGEYLKNNKFDFVEIADVFNPIFNFKPLFNSIIEISINEKQRKHFLLNRTQNHKKVKFLDKLNNYQSRKDHIILKLEKNMTNKMYKNLATKLLQQN